MAAPHDEPAKTGVYATRWWILTLYTSIAFLQGMTWGIPGPISSTYESFYGMSPTIVQLLVNYGPIFYVPFALPFALLMDRQGGLPRAVQIGLGLTLISAILRMLAGDASTLSLALVHVSYVLNAIAGPIAMGGVSKVSEDWFPPQERTLATAIMSEANAISFSQVLGPYTVTSNDWWHIQVLNIIVLAMVAPFFIASLIYFPAAPPLPPSVSAAHQKAAESGFNLTVFARGVKALVGDARFWILALSYGITSGVYGSWATVLSINLSNLNESAQMVGLIAFVGNLVGNIAGVVVGHFADRFRNHQRLIVWLLTSGTVCFLLFTLVCTQGVLPASLSTGAPATAAMFVLSALGGLCVFGSIPLFFELAVECTYPIPEATVVTMLTLMNNVGGLIFLSIPTSAAGTAWMNWFMTGACAAAAAAMMLAFTGKSVRFAVDTGAAIETEGADGTSTVVLLSDGGMEDGDEPLLSDSDHAVLLAAAARASLNS